MTLATASDNLIIEIDGETLSFPADIDPIGWAMDCEEDAEDEGGHELVAFGWKAAAVLLAIGVPTIHL